jgi:hypothetical protein
MRRILCILIALAVAGLVQTCCADGSAWTIPSATPPEPGRIMEPESHTDVLVLGGLFAVLGLSFLIPGVVRAARGGAGWLLGAVRRVVRSHGAVSTFGKKDDADSERECDARPAC